MCASMGSRVTWERTLLTNTVVLLLVLFSLALWITTSIFETFRMHPRILFCSVREGGLEGAWRAGRVLPVWLKPISVTERARMPANSSLYEDHCTTPACRSTVAGADPGVSLHLAALCEPSLSPGWGVCLFPCPKSGHLFLEASNSSLNPAKCRCHAHCSLCTVSGGTEGRNWQPFQESIHIVAFI